MNISIYDFLGKNRYCQYIDGEQSIKELRNWLVDTKNLANNNKAPYLIDLEDFSFDDIVGIDYEKEKITLNRNVLYYPYRLFNKLKGMPDDIRIESAFLKENCNKLQRKYHIDTSNDKYTIITIPDRMDVQQRDALLSSAKSSGLNNPILLWRSIAACLGANDEQSFKNLKDGDFVLIIDSNPVGILLTKLKIHKTSKTNDIPIPGHYNYRNAEGRVSSNYYHYYAYEKNIENLLPFHVTLSSSQCIVFKKNDSSNEKCNLNNINVSTVKLIINLNKDSNNLQSDWRALPAVINDSNDDLVFKGAYIFADRMDSGAIPYYEECEALNLVLFSRATEEYYFKELIKYTEMLPAGRSIQQETINGISLQPGEKVGFYLLFGNVDRTKPLRYLEQPLNVSKDNIEHSKNTPLSLEASVFAGQGQAVVKISQETPSDPLVINPVNLDWQLMKISNTLAWLEEHLERSFPIDIPAVEADASKFIRELSDIQYYISNPGIYTLPKLNKSTWPNKDKQGIERFRRQNVFGNAIGKDLPITNDINKNIAVRLFEELSNQYNRVSSDKDAILTTIGWTYHKEYFGKAINDVIRRIKEAATSKVGVPPQYFTCIANMVDDDKLLIEFYKSLAERLKNPDRIDHWCRGAYSILMFHTAFLKQIDYKTHRNLLRNLCIASIHNKLSGKDSVSKNIDNVLLFLLKVRRYYPNFCKNNSNNASDRDDYSMLRTILMNPLAVFVKSLIEISYDIDKGLNATIFNSTNKPFRYCVLDYYSSHYFIPSYYNNWIANMKSSNLLPDECEFEDKKWEEAKLDEIGDKLKKIYHFDIMSRRYSSAAIECIKKYIDGKGDLNIPVED